MYKTIYIPVDNSDHSNTAVDVGVELAKTYGSKIVGSHVYAAKMHDKRFKQMEAGLPEEYHDEKELDRQRQIHDSLITRGLQIITDSYLDYVDKKCNEANLPVERRSLEGRNWKVLAEDINTNAYDLVIMGALGVGAVKDSVIGSNTERVLRRVRNSDMLIIKQPTPVGSGKIVVAVDGRRLKGIPGFRGLVVVNEVRDVTVPQADGLVVYAKLPTVEELRPKAWLDSRGTVRKGRKKSTGNKAKISFLDFISDIVTSAGYIVYWRPPATTQLAAIELVITNPRTHYGSSRTAGDSFPGAVDIRRFAYGSNIEELNLKRSLKGTAVPSVGVKTYDAATGEVYAKIYPPVPKDNRPSPTSDGARTEIKVYALDQISGGA